MPMPDQTPPMPIGEPDNALMVATPAIIESEARAITESMMNLAIRKPRPDIAKIRSKMLSLATIDEETAESCIYSLPRRDSETGERKLIQGPSIRLAEILVYAWENLRAGARIIGNDGRKVTAQGICFDLEANIMQSAEVSRRITHRDGRPFSEDMQLVVGQAACSIAKRNAVFSVVPFALVKPVYHQIKEVITGNVSTLQVKRDKLFKRFYAMGVTQAQILAVLYKESVDAVDLEDVAALVGLGTAIKDKEITIEEAFTIPAEEEDTPRPKLSERLAAMRAARKALEVPVEKPVESEEKKS